MLVLKYCQTFQTQFEIQNSGSRHAVVRQSVRQSSGSKAISRHYSGYFQIYSMRNSWDCKFIHCAAHGAERLFFSVKLEICLFFWTIALTQHIKVQTENIHCPLFGNPSFFQWMNESTKIDKSTKLTGSILESWRSEATPSATPFFKRAYKISHSTGL